MTLKREPTLKIIRPKQRGDTKPGKTGNLLGEVPLDVPYAGCWNLDCIAGCDLSKNHCQRLADAFRRAGYSD